MQGRLVLEPIRDGARQLVGQERQGFPLSVFLLHARAIVLSCRLVTQEPRCGLRKGPREVGVADFVAGRAQAFAGRCLGTLAQTARGDTILHRWKAVHGVHCLEQHEAEELAETRNRLPQIQRVSVMVCGRLDAREFDIAPQLVLRGAQGQVDLDALLHGGIDKACSDALAGGFVGALLAALGQVIWTRGIVDMGQQCSALAHQVGAGA